MMTWYEHLYTGEKAQKQRFSVIQKLRERRAGAFVYVIVPAANEKNLLDIYSAPDFFAREDWEKERNGDDGGSGHRMILGIALGYQEALTLAGEMVDEVYQATGGFGIREYLGICGGQGGIGEVDDTDIIVHS